MRAHRAAEPARGRAAARADRRAHAARRARGELLVPAPPRRLRVDRRAGRRRCGSPTSPAARATARTCSRGRAADVVGVDANPEAHEHARLRYRRAEPALRARPGRGLRASPATRSSSCRRSSTSTSPGALLARLRRARAGRLRLDAEPAHARAARGARSPTTRGTCASTRPPSTGSCSSRISRGRDPRPLPRPQAARSTSSRSALGWDRVHQALRITKPFYDRFVPAIAASRLRAPPGGRVRPRPGARLRRRLPRVSPPPSAASDSATSRSSSTATCPTSRDSAPTRSARSGCSTPCPLATCRCSRSPTG